MGMANQAQIRAARFTDIPELKRLMKLALASSKFQGLAGLDEEALRRVAMDCIGRQTDTPGDCMIVVAEQQGRLCAVFAGIIRPLYECLDIQVATNLIWFAEPGTHPKFSLGVMDAFIDWADQSEQPVLHRYGISDAVVNHHAIGALLVRKRGFALAGGLYEKGP